MVVRNLGSDDRLALERGAAVVCVAWGEGGADAEATLRSVVEHTEAAVPVVVVVADGAGLASVSVSVSVSASGEGEVRGEREVAAVVGAGGWIGAVEAAAALVAPGDVVAVRAGTRVGPGWLEGLRAAALSDSTVVSASALTDTGDRLGVGAGPFSDERALVVAAASARAYPRIAGPGADCVYVRRAGLDLAGGMAEFSERTLSRGLEHVAADDVMVGVGAHPDDGEVAGLAGQLAEYDRHDQGAVLRRALAGARTALGRLSVTVDARALGPALGGTQAYIVQLVLALAASDQVEVRVVAPPDLSPEAARAFAGAPRVELIDYDQAVAGVPLTDVVHRPQQVFTVADLNLLHLLGERIVIDQQDLIAYRNPAYHESAREWEAYRRVTRLALAGADRAVFFSRHARDDAALEDLVAPERCVIAGIGADLEAVDGPARARPEGCPEGVPLLVCLGADYEHKNRPFAIAVLDALRREHGWEGTLVLAGGHVAHGSSREAERRLLEGDPELARHVVDVGSVDELGRAWLFANARAVVYPSTYEGFGLVPFEAARADAPCLFAPQASLVELAGAEAAVLVPWDASASAAAAAPLLVDGAERGAHVRRLREAADAHRWSDVVERLVGAYVDAVRGPRRAAAPRAWQELERERYIVELADGIEHLKGIATEYQDAFHDLERRVGGALPLVDEGGALTPDVQRGLMRIAARRPLRAALLGPVGLLGRLGRGDGRQ